MRHLLLLFLAYATFLLPLQAQDYARRPVDFDLLIQEIFAQQEEETLEYEDFYETLLLYYQQPLDLNQTSPEQLASLYILSRPQITALFKHLDTHGPLLSIYELQAIPGFDLVTIYQLLPFVQVTDAGLQATPAPLWQRVIGADNHALILRYERTLQQRRGYTAADTGARVASRYLGSPEKLLLRYRVSHPGDFSFGLTAEKDAGEQFTWDAPTRRYGFDFYSAHLQLYNKGRFKAIALGDYQLQIGQGLLLGSGYSVGKGSETITTTSRANLGIRPYSSVLEYNYFRGAAFTYSLGRIDASGFYSNKRVDANLQAQPDTLQPFDDFFSGIQTSGFHRTPSELANKGQVREQVYGTNLSYRSPGKILHLGFTALGTHYSAPMQKAGAPYQLFAFSGRRNHNAGMNYSLSWQNLYFFGETAVSSSGGVGTVNGLMASLSGKVDMALLYRNYARHFHSFYGNAFGEGTRNSNERGLYTGIKIKPLPHWEVTAYYDHFRFPWLGYRVDAPSYGDEYLVRLLFKPNRQGMLYAQFRTESKGLNAANTARMDYVAQALRRNYLLSYEFAPTKTVTLKSRVQFSSYTHEGPRQTGYLIAQDLLFNFDKVRLSTRFALFDTDSYDTRQYVYERDVLYAFAIPAFSGRGTRCYALLQLRPSRDLDVWVKYGVTRFRNQDTIGSGLETIEGCKRSEMKMQVRYRF